MGGGDQNGSLFTYETLVHAISGAAGSVVAMGTLFPLDTVKSRLQLEEGREAKNTLAVIHDLVMKEGPYTLYRGMVPVLQSLCASNFVYFYTFHGLKMLRSKRNQTAGNDLMVASIAGIVTVLTTTPLWVVNTRLKMRGVGGQGPERNNNEYNTLLDGLVQIWKYEGLGKLWAGTLPSLMLVTNPAIQFMTYESIKRRITATLKGAQPPAWMFFAIGAVAKTIATALTYPLQLVQTKLRQGHKYPNLPPDAGTLQILLYILKIVWDDEKTSETEAEGDRALSSTDESTPIIDGLNHPQVLSILQNLKLNCPCTTCTNQNLPSSSRPDDDSDVKSSSPEKCKKKKWPLRHRKYVDTSSEGTSSDRYNDKERRKKRSKSGTVKNPLILREKTSSLINANPKGSDRQRSNFSFFNALFDIVFWPYVFLKSNR